MEYNFISTPYRIDRKLYKYYSNIKYAIDSISKGRIHLDDPSGFNDPFDAAFSLHKYTIMDSYESLDVVLEKVISYTTQSSASARSEIVNPLLSLMNQQLEFNKKMPIRKAIRFLYDQLHNKSCSFDTFCDIIDNGFAKTSGYVRLDCRISCFSEVWDSILMWSYYAQSHKGVCVEYDLSKLNQNNVLNRQIIQSMSKVHYSPIRADALVSEHEEDWLNFVMSKSDVWAHEHEWRIVCETQEEYLPFDCITNVYLGVNFDMNANKYQELLKTVKNKKSINIYKCVLNQEKFQIDKEMVYDAPFMQGLSKYLEDNNIA